MKCLAGILLSRGFLRVAARHLQRSIAQIASSPIRPELDFDFLLNDANLETIRKNIVERKGNGDIDAVRRKWHELQALMKADKKPKLTEGDLKRMWDDFYDEALRIPNLSHPDAPKGNMDNAKVIASWGTKQEGPCVSAERLVQRWRTLLYPSDACGERSYAFVGALANLERALLEYVFDRVTVLNFEPMSVPDLVTKEITEACGIGSRGSPKDIQYSLQDEDHIALSGTAEMGISAFLKNRTFQEEELPIRLVAESRRLGAGTVSNSVALLLPFRLEKEPIVEMYVVCTPEQSEGELDYLVDIQKGTFESLGLHCRQMDMPTEELGAPAARKVDIEVWMPGRGLYGEVSSASNCTDYQARRLGIRYTTKSGEKKFVHTCNGTAVASTRTLIGLLESFQTERKSLDNLPDVIRSRLKTVRPPPLRFHPAKPLS